MTVNEKVNLGREYVKELRAILYACRKFGVEAAKERFMASYYGKNVLPGKAAPAFAEIIRGEVMYVGRINGYSSRAFLALARGMRVIDSGFRVPEEHTALL